MTLDELILRLQALRVEHPDLGRLPARLMIPEYDGGRYDRDAPEECVDARAWTDGVALGHTPFRTPIAPAENRERVESDRKVVALARMRGEVE